jgi:hypothetical protein
MLARLPLCNNTDGARVEFHEILAPYAEGQWHGDLYFQADWVQQQPKLHGRQPKYPRDTELVLARGS